MNTSTTNPYSTGHPWYYVLGGIAPSPKSILRDVIEDDYKGYNEREITKASNLAEPNRSASLRKFHQNYLESYRANLSIYRQRTRELRNFRSRDNAMDECFEIHTSMSFKVCHLYNDLAHLRYLDYLLSQQPDLFL